MERWGPVPARRPRFREQCGNGYVVCRGILLGPSAMAKPRLLKAKICIVGEAAVGKTSLIRRFVLDQFDDSYLMTLQAKVSKKTVEIPMAPDGDPVTIEMSVWDLMGQRRFRELLLEAYFQGVSGIIAVAD